jgi:dTDP-glucose 4,6-dehydratase
MFFKMESTRQYNILVTGGLGFIGWNFLRYLYHQDKLKFNKVINVDARFYSAINSCYQIYYDKRYSFVNRDIKHVSEEFLRNHSIDLIINFAASTHVDNSIKSCTDFVYNNIVGAVSLADNAKNYWKNDNIDGLFVQISTDECFGSVEDQGGFPFDENTLHHPNNPYSASKSAAEVMLRSFMHTYQFPAIITNCSNNYGRGQHEEKLIPKIIDNYIRNKKIPIYGNGLQKRDWIYVDDHCQGIIDSILYGIRGNSYLFGTNKTITNIELTKTVIGILDDKTGNRKDNLIEFVEDRLGHDITYQIDYARSLCDLGWSPQIELKEGLENTINWYLSKR